MDLNRANKLIDYISSSLMDLKEYLDDYKAKIGKERIVFDAISKKGEEIIESSSKLNKLILDELNITSYSYYDTFTNLEELKIFTKKEIESLSKTSSFRNRIAHEYMDIKKENTLLTIEKILKIYPKYLAKIIDYIEENY